MKKAPEIIALFFTICLVYLSCIDNTTTQKEKAAPLGSGIVPNALTEVEFTTKRHDFGVLTSDTLVEVVFPFKNIGENDLIVDYVDPDCTCTGYELSADTILPGDSATIKIKFNTKHKYGEQKIYVVVSLNTEIELYKLMFIANVID